MAVQPLPCASGSGDTGPDVEQLLLCDLLPDGSIAGTALAVYEYDETGAPVGAPTFVDPATGVPYVAQGILQPCPGEVGCGAPVQFCFQSTAPVDQPGRMYDTVLTLGQGFAVQALVKDLVETPLNIVWQVTDPTGAQFATDLQTALQSQFPGQTVTVTPGVVDPCSGGTADFAVHIECLRIDQSPPTLLQFKYNSGRDLIINAGFLASPATSQFAYMKRLDGTSPVASVNVLCTGTVNRGWENNDKSRAFETWGPPGSGQNVSEGTTPTPRGTVVQEINAYGSGATPTAGGAAGNPGFGQSPDTIWQTFVVPAAGNFIIKVVVGGRSATENIPIKLSTGDVGDAGIGDVINTSVNAPKVTKEGGTPAGPWTTFTQTVPLSAGTYTLAFTGPTQQDVPGGNNGSGGLFTDMRVYQDAPNTVRNFVNDDDSCTVPTTSTSTVCEFWAPRCSRGQIVGWYNVADGQELTNAAFWAQVPAPTCCSSSSDAGSSSVGNLVYSYLVCGTLNGESRTMSHVVVSDQAGGIIADTFVDSEGGPVTPDSWQPGGCGGDAPTIGDHVLCDTGADGTIIEFLRAYTMDTGGQIVLVTDSALDGTPYTPVGTVGTCAAEFTGVVCDAFGDSPPLPAIAPTCPGTALGAALGFSAGSGMTQGPVGTYTPTSGTNAGLLWDRSPNDDQHALCSVRLVNDAGTGDDPFWQLIGSFVDANGIGQNLDAVWITAIEAALGVGDASDIPAGSTAMAALGGTSVTITFDGPSPHSQMFAGNGVFFVREQDGDGLAAGITLAFDPPIRSFALATNVVTPSPGSISGVQEAQATPGTAAQPGQPGGVTEVKQFRRSDGSSFYENFDGTPYTVVGTVQVCTSPPQFTGIVCDQTITPGPPFVCATVATPSTPGFVRGFTDTGGGNWEPDGTDSGSMNFAEDSPKFCSFEATLNDQTGLYDWEQTFIVVEADGSFQTLDLLRTTQLAAAMGVPLDTGIAPGTTGSILIGSTTVTLTILGPSSNLMLPSDGKTLQRNADGDGQAAAYRFDFSPPLQQVGFFYAGDNPAPGASIGGMALALATAQSIISSRPIKQFHGPTGAVTYTALDGTPYTPVGTLATCSDPAAFEDVLVCATLPSGQQVPALRRENRQADGSSLVTFLSANGATVTPTSWFPGPCPVGEDGHVCAPANLIVVSEGTDPNILAAGGTYIGGTGTVAHALYGATQFTPSRITGLNTAPSTPQNTRGAGLHVAVTGGPVPVEFRFHVANVGRSNTPGDGIGGDLDYVIGVYDNAAGTWVVADSIVTTGASVLMGDLVGTDQEPRYSVGILQFGDHTWTRNSLPVGDYTVFFHGKDNGTSGPSDQDSWDVAIETTSPNLAVKSLLVGLDECTLERLAPSTTVGCTTCTSVVLCDLVPIASAVTIPTAGWTMTGLVGPIAAGGAGNPAYATASPIFYFGGGSDTVNGVATSPVIATLPGASYQFPGLHFGSVGAGCAPGDAVLSVVAYPSAADAAAHTNALYTQQLIHGGPTNAEAPVSPITVGPFTATTATTVIVVADSSTVRHNCDVLVNIPSDMQVQAQPPGAGTTVPFERTTCRDCTGAVVDVTDTLLDGTPYTALGVVGMCSTGGTSGTGCGTASSIGTVCYTPPPTSIPGQTFTDDWAGSTVVGANGSAQTITNLNFAGTGLPVKWTSARSESLRGTAPTGIFITNTGRPNGTFHHRLDLGVPRLNVTIQLVSFGTGDAYDNIIPAPTSVTGLAVLVGGDGVNPTSDGQAVMHFAGPVQVIDLDYVQTSTATGTVVGSISYDTATVAIDTEHGTAAVIRDCATGAVTYLDLVTGDPVDLSTVTVVDCGASAETPESLTLCDITQVPSLNGVRAALNLTTLPNGPTSGAFPNGIGFTADQGVPGASGTYLINGSSTQTWTFSEPAMLRFGVNNLNVGSECVTLPIGTVAESINASHTYNAATRVLCNGGAAAVTDESTFTLAAATTLTITSNPGGGGQRGLVRLEAGHTTFTEVRTPFLRTICRTCGVAPVITDTALDGLTPYVTAGIVGVCDVNSCTDTVLGEICYTPPVSPPVTLTDNWAGATLVGANGAAQTLTNPGFGGSAISVVSTMTPGAGMQGATDIRLTRVPAAAGAMTVTTDLGAPRNNILLTFNFFGTITGENLTAISPPAIGVTGAATLGGGGTTLTPTAADGSGIVLHFPDGTQHISYTWGSTGGLSSQGTISFTTIGSVQTYGTAAVVQDCTTGDISYVDLATGSPLVAGAFTVVDCPSGSSAVSGTDTEILTLCDTATDGTSIVFLRQLLFAADSTVTVKDTTLDGTIAHTVTGTVGQCPASERTVLQECRCDALPGGDIVGYVELIAVSADGTLSSLGTYTENLAAPYVPVSPVDCAAVPEGADPLVHVQARRVQLNPGQTWDAATYPTLQAVNVLAFGGTATISTVDGTSTLHETEAAGWSVTDEASLVGPLTVTAGTGTVTVNFTTN